MTPQQKIYEVLYVVGVVEIHSYEDPVSIVQDSHTAPENT